MVTLSASEQIKLQCVVKVLSGIMKTATACCLLGVSARTLRRYLKAYRFQEVLGMKHGNYRRRPINKTSDTIKQQVLELIKDKYFDFNMLHLQEKLRDEGFSIKRETLRKWCHEIKMVKRSHRRRSHPRYYRDRMPQPGMLVQFDGSHHRWFDGRETCLFAAIDDATGEVHARFFEGETTVACLQFLEQLIQSKGSFQTLYVDKAGVYGGVKREGFSQVQRALQELGVHTLFAHSPQAKGRVERLFKTMQDRLVPEMRLNKVRTIEQANEYLESVYLPTHNAKFTVLSRNPASLYRPIHPSYNTAEIFCIKEYRIVGNDHTISWCGEKYMIAEQLRYSLAKQKIEIRLYPKGGRKCFFAGKAVTLVKVERIKKIAA